MKRLIAAVPLCAMLLTTTAVPLGSMTSAQAQTARRPHHPPLPVPPSSAQRICARYFDNFDERMGSPRARPALNSPTAVTTVGPPMPSPPPGAVPPPPPPPPPPPLQPGRVANDVVVTAQRAAPPAAGMPQPVRPVPLPAQESRERYDGEAVANALLVADAPVSTFSVDVDTGSYANVRRMLTAGQVPPGAAVRTEELVNYFRYDYPLPQDRSRPFSISHDVMLTPWNTNTRLMRVGLRGFDLPRSERPPSNFVFLVDVSGSMNNRDKLPLVQCSLALLAEELSPRDRVGIVTYASGERILLEPTSDRQAVLRALEGLRAGGSTAGQRGLAAAYEMARRNFNQEGVNRILLATDGDFNVGVTSTEALLEMVERERRAGISLSTLGFGTGNYNEAMMEQIADHGNGNYSYIDSADEAAKVLQDEMAAALFTIASDVKVQIEFNPAYVGQYRLIGYENRALAEQDFDNDAVDAGEIGAGHQVTALYELVPAGRAGWLPQRRYEANRREAAGNPNGELGWLRVRYKLPGESESRLIEQPIRARDMASARAPRGDAAFITAVAAYGQLLRGDTMMNRYSFADARALAAPHTRGQPLREQFLWLADQAERLRAQRTP